MTTSTVPVQAPAKTRVPVSIRAAAVLLPVLVAAHVAGGVLFGFIWSDDPVGPGLVYLAFAVATAATAVAVLPRLFRGERLAWLVVTAWTVSFDYWSVYKVFGMPEYSSLPFLGGGLLLLALLAAPSARAHVGGVL